MFKSASEGLKTMNNKSNRNEERKGVNLLVLGVLNFPRASAPTSRISAYAKAIIENNGSVTVLCLRAIGVKSLGHNEIPASGVVDGIKYVYAPGATMRPESFWVRTFFKFEALLRSFGIIWRLDRAQKIDAFLFFGTYALHEILFTFLARSLRIPVIRERNEHPFRDLTSFRKKLRAYWHKRFEVRLYDGIILITRFLENYYKPLMKKDTKYIRVPILVEMSRFEGAVSADSKGRYIAYCGDPGGNKDGVPILIEAFSMIAQKYSDLRLYIIGDSGHKNVLPNLKEQARKLNIEDRVIFTGRISREEMPQYLCNATILALARPTSLQAQAGFPTKLGEYLTTAKPVVVTDVGEIAEFLRDGESAFIAEPDSVISFADKLDFVLSNPELARKVGLRGKELALKTFDYRIQAKRIISFIKELKASHFPRASFCAKHYMTREGQ